MRGMDEMRSMNESIMNEMSELRECILDKVNVLDRKHDELMKICTNISKFLRKEKSSNIDQFKVKVNSAFMVIF